MIRFKTKEVVLYVSYDENRKPFSHVATIQTPKRIDFIDGSLFVEIVDSAVKILKEDGILKNKIKEKRFIKKIFKSFKKSGFPL